MRVLTYVGTICLLLVSAMMIPLASGEGEKFEFQAEVSRLMDIIINSLYQKKEIFLRELISNGSDALDKLRLLALEDPSLYLTSSGEKLDLEIKITFDAAERTLTIRDTGIGMTKEDLIENLGTVAKSGTTQFVESMSGGADMSLIGQFGVGFYSVYLVADKVRVTSKHNSDDQYVWESTADSTFSVELDPQGNTLGRGSEITLFLKEDALEYANQDRVEGLVKRYSEFITFPIFLHKSKTETVAEEEEEEDDEEDDEEEDDDLKTSDDEEEEESPKTKEVTSWVWEQVNTQKAIWTRSENDINDSEYEAFYQAISKDMQKPLTWTHFRAEGEVEFKSILYIPKSSPPGMMDNYYNTKAALKLYVRKVLITDEFEELIPKYLSFIKGVVDSDDLPLNVSRETLQQHKVLKVMGKKLLRKILDLLRKMSDAEEAKKKKNQDEDDEDEEEGKVAEYSTFWKNFGKNIKLGVIEDSSNRNRLTKLLRFSTTHSENELTSLPGYVERMPEWQKSIYYMAGSDLDVIKKSPFLEQAIAKNVEVLLMNDPLDEYCVQQLPEFEGFKLQSLTKEGLKFGDETELDSKREKLYKEKFKPLTEWMKKLLSSNLDKISVSNRVTDTPAILVTSQFGYSANMEKIMKHQAFGSQASQMQMGSKKSMEINARHPIVEQLLKLCQSDPESQEAMDLVYLMYDTSLLNSGFDMDDTTDFASRMYRVMQRGLGLDTLDLLPEIEIPVVEDDLTGEKEEL